MFRASLWALLLTSMWLPSVFGQESGREHPPAGGPSPGNLFVEGYEPLLPMTLHLRMAEVGAENWTAARKSRGARSSFTPIRFSSAEELFDASQVHGSKADFQILEDSRIAVLAGHPATFISGLDWPNASAAKISNGSPIGPGANNTVPFSGISIICVPRVPGQGKTSLAIKVIETDLQQADNSKSEISRDLKVTTTDGEVVVIPWPHPKADGKVLLLVLDAKVLDENTPSVTETRPQPPVSVVHALEGKVADFTRTQASPDPQPGLTIPVTDNMKVTVAPGGSAVLQFPQRVKTVDGFDSRILAVRPVDPSQLRVVGGDQGITVMSVTTEDNQKAQVTVLVRPNYLELEELIERFWPEAQIEIVPVRDAILLRGTAPSEEAVQEVVEVTEQYVPRVLNQLRIQADKSSAVEQRLNEEVILSLLDIPLSELGDRLSDSTGIKFRVEITSPPERKLSFAFRGISLRSALVHICKELGAEWEVRDDGIVITDVFTEQTEAEANADLDPFAKMSNRARPTPNRSHLGETSSLQEDIEALHHDVRRLIQLLEERAAHEAKPEPKDDTARVEQKWYQPVEQNLEQLEKLEQLVVQELDQPDDSVLYFRASWCGPCQRAEAMLKGIPTPPIPLIKVDIDEHPQLAKALGIEKVPTFVRWKDGRRVAQAVGVMSRQSFLQFCRSLEQPEIDVAKDLFQDDDTLPVVEGSKLPAIDLLFSPEVRLPVIPGKSFDIIDQIVPEKSETR